MNTIPASSNAWRTASMLWGRGFLTPFSKSLIVISLRLAFAPSRTRDQFSRDRAALNSSAESYLRLFMSTQHSIWLRCSP